MSGTKSQFRCVHCETGGQLSRLMSLFLETRRWERANIPFASPQIAFDIALYATVVRLEKQKVSAKTVHLTVGHSADRVREVLLNLEADGWVAKVPHHDDGRIKLIEATDKLVMLMNDYADARNCCCSRAISHLCAAADD